MAEHIAHDRPTLGIFLTLAFALSHFSKLADLWSILQWLRSAEGDEQTSVHEGKGQISPPPIIWNFDRQEVMDFSFATTARESSVAASANHTASITKGLKVVVGGVLGS